MTPLRRQLQSMLRVEPLDGGFTATFTLDPALSILPGVCMVQLVLLSAATALNLPDLHLKRLKSAKILHPIRPNDRVQIEGTITPNPDDTLTIKANFTTASAQRCAEFSLTATAHLPPLPPGEASGISDCPRAGWGEGELRATSNTRMSFTSPGTPGEGREGVPSSTSPVTRVFNPCRATPPVEPSPFFTTPHTESGCA